MTLDEYQEAAKTFAPLDAPCHVQRFHYIMGLSEETGEVMSIFKRLARGDTDQLDTTQLCAELGDVLWYVTLLAHSYGITLQDVGQGNITKLTSRAQRGVIQGKGDDR